LIHLLQPTDAEYFTIVNPAAGLLVATQAYSPRFWIKARNLDTIPPDLEHWSDFAWIAWTKAVKKAPKAKALQSFMTFDIANTETLENWKYIQEKLEESSGGSANLSYPGINFYPGQRYFYALLASPNISGLVWMYVDLLLSLSVIAFLHVTFRLLNRKEDRDIGVRTVSQISFFRTHEKPCRFDEDGCLCLVLRLRTAPLGLQYSSDGYPRHSNSSWPGSQCNRTLATKYR
jgi:hypothetical protein